VADSSRTENPGAGKVHSCYAVALSALKSRRFYSVYATVLLFAYCTLFYYFGELIDYAGWERVRQDFFYGVHDVQRLVFLAPIIYAGYTFRVKGALAVTVAAFLTFLPRGLVVSPYPDPVLRMGLFIVVAACIGVLTGMVRNEAEKRSQLEARLTSERDRMLSMLENMEEGVIIVGPDYRIRYTNQSMRKSFGEGVGSTCYQYLNGLDDQCGDICRLPKVIAGAVERWEYVLQDGRTFEVVGSPFVDSDGTSCHLGTFRNITQRKQLELELIELNRLKSELLSNVSHELRSPLTSIKGIISSLLQRDIEWDSETLDMLLTGISEETDRLASLVTNLLNMSKIEAHVCETLEQQKWVHKSHTFEVELESGLPEVYADYNQMKQVLINLLENAAAYSDGGTTIWVGARAVDGEVEVRVSDQGVGIPADNLDKIFDKFYRGTQRRQRPGGTGLGLAICRALVLAHGGRIWAESEIGQGSTFYFSLPVAQAGHERGSKKNAEEDQDTRC
jgi:nitrogen-specific signal transduction histidine kinase